MAAKKSLKQQKQEVIKEIEDLGFLKTKCIGCSLEKNIREMLQIGDEKKYICKNCLTKLEAGELYKPKITITQGDSWKKQYNDFYDGTISTTKTNKKNTWYGASAIGAIENLTEVEYKNLLTFANGY